MLRITTEMEYSALLKTMEQVQVRSRVQIQLLEKLQVNSPENVEALQLATRAMQNVRISAEDTLQNPVTFRLRHGTANRPIATGFT